MYDTSKHDIELIKKWLGTGSINIFGLPFSGKDTHSRYLAEIFGANILGGGQILRNSVIPQHVKDIIDKGGLAPTDDYVRIVLPYLSKEEFAGKPLILSSVGRWHGEEDGVLKAAAESNHPVKAVIFLSLDTHTAKERFLKAEELGDRDDRADDHEDHLMTRFSEFETKTLPVIDYYRSKGMLIEVDGIPPKSEVGKEILTGLELFANRA